MTDLRTAAQQALEQVQEFKRRWWLVPAFGNKVNKATREAITNAHSPIFELEHALRAALAAPDTCTWQPMDTAPFDTDLLVIKESGFICQDYRSKQYPTTWTYWMPLPNAPIKQAEGENT